MNFWRGLRNLLSRWRSRLGDEAAFEELVRLHNPRLLGFAQRMLQSAPETIPDIMQDVWVAIYRSLPRLCDANKFSCLLSVFEALRAGRGREGVGSRG